MSTISIRKPVRESLSLLLTAIGILIAMQSTYAVAQEEHKRGEHAKMSHSASSHGEQQAKTDDKDEPVGDPYTLGTCPVTGQKLGSMGDPIIHDHNGREIRFCCSGCVAKFEKEAATYLEKIDEDMIEQQLAFYPVETCPVNGEKLGSMGDPINYVHNNRLVRFCCKGCFGMFAPNPAKFLEKLDRAAIEKQMPDYPLASCPVTGQKLDAMGKPVDIVVAGRLIRLCCEGCKNQVRKDPLKYLAKLDTGPQDEPAAEIHGSREASEGHEGHKH